jgi:hypothetical protein
VKSAPGRRFARESEVWAVSEKMSYTMLPYIVDGTAQIMDREVYIWHISPSSGIYIADQRDSELAIF